MALQITRNDILARDLHDVVTKPDDCVVVSGTLEDAYTGATIEFRRGPNSDEVQIDHVVALSNAWQTGAQTLTPDQRRDLANDPDNLQAVRGSANQQKGDAGAASWLPRTEYRCTYTARQVQVKTRYGLWVTPAEHDALARILNAC
ncbi:HNH endonuclease family protein [Nocardia tengchongensis]|uniref:HNH endonuclease family protein n=1 Tax=Nocardia tengchongensis TaxID=2055889 RepID=UPI00368536E8